MPSRPFDSRRPFTRAAARRAGITDGMLRGPGFRRLYTGVHLRSDVRVWPTTYIEAALLLHPESAFASHSSAAELLRLPVPDDHLVHISVFEKADRRRREGIRPHLAVSDAAVTRQVGLRVSTPTQLFLEMGEYLNLVDLVVLGDAIVRRELSSVDELRKAAERWAGRRAGLVQRAAGRVRPGVDSPMESRLRMLIVLAGLPEPQVNRALLRRDGSVFMRLDLSYPELGIVIEYDGQQHVLDLDQVDTDLDRDDWFQDGRWHVVKVVARGIFRRPDRTLERVHHALLARNAPGLPRVLSDEWRAYFPVKP
jgi:hypothetical protein